MASAGLAVISTAKPTFDRDSRGIRIVFSGSQIQFDRCFDRVSLVINRIDPKLIAAWQIPVSLRRPSLQQSISTSNTQWIDAGHPPIQPEIENVRTIHIDSQPLSLHKIHLLISAQPAIDILSAAVSDRPRQMMVRLRNNSASGAASLRVESSHPVEKPIELPTIGGTGDVFIDLSDATAIMPISLVDDSGQPLSDVAIWQAEWLPARLEMIAAPTPAIRRFCDAYRQVHPATPSSPVVLIGNGLPQDQAGVFAAIANEPMEHFHVSQQPHPMLSHTDLTPLEVVPIHIASSPPSDAWQVIATANGRPILAVRESPARQVWLGFAAESFEKREEFVVLLADAVDWISQGSEVHGRLDDTSSTPTVPDEATIERAIAEATRSRRDLAPALSVLAVVLAGVAALTRR